MTAVKFFVKFSEPKEQIFKNLFNRLNIELENIIIELPYSLDKDYKVDFMKSIPLTILNSPSGFNGHPFSYFLNEVCKPEAKIESILMTLDYLKVTILVDLKQQYIKE